MACRRLRLIATSGNQHFAVLYSLLMKRTSRVKDDLSRQVHDHESTLGRLAGQSDVCGRHHRAELAPARVDIVVEVDKSFQRMTVSTNGAIVTGLDGAQRLRHAERPVSTTNDAQRWFGPASLGCVRLHPSHAAALFDLIKRWTAQHPDHDFELVRISPKQAPVFTGC